MLLTIAMRRVLLPIVVVFAATLGGLGLVSCSDEKPAFGNAGGALGRPLPGETVGAAAPTSTGTNGPFSGPYDANANKPTTTLAKGHAGGGKLPVDGKDVTATSQCTSCHVAGGAAPTKAWSFGGRVVNTAKTGGEPNADVIVVNADGKVVGEAKTDDEGFFWAPVGANVLAADAKTSVRTAKGVIGMNTKLGTTDASCDKSGCHSAQSPGSIKPKP